MAYCKTIGLGTRFRGRPHVRSHTPLQSEIHTHVLVDHPSFTHPASFKKAELKTFLQFHREGEEPLRDDEITILNGVLSLNDRKASEIMTHIKDVLCLPSDHVLDHAALDHILLSGFSRIPVYEPGQKENFVGMLLVKRVRSSVVFLSGVRKGGLY